MNRLQVCRTVGGLKWCRRVMIYGEVRLAECAGSGGQSRTRDSGFKLQYARRVPVHARGFLQVPLNPTPVPDMSETASGATKVDGIRPINFSPGKREKCPSI